jgi:integrase
MLPESVILLHNKSVYGKISAFLKDVGLKSQRTQKEYHNDIVQFFKLMRGKTLEQLKPEDLQFENDDIKRYKETLTGHYKGTSVNRKISTMRSLFSDLAKNTSLKSYIDPMAFDVKPAPKEIEGYGTLTWEEVSEMIERVKTHNNGIQKSVFLELSGRTSIRLDALLGVTWNNITPMKDFYLLTVIDKGKKQDEKPIPASLYERMLELRQDGVDQIFSLTKRTIQRTIKDLCEEMGIEESRNITAHSLKKMGVEYDLERTGDIFSAARQGNHSNIQTTYRHYTGLNKRNAIPNMAGLQMGKTIDMSVLTDLTKEQLLSVISNAGESILARIVREAEKLKK